MIARLLSNKGDSRQWLSLYDWGLLAHPLGREDSPHPNGRNILWTLSGKMRDNLVLQL